jgi:hypothetical protein
MLRGRQQYKVNLFPTVPARGKHLPIDRGDLMRTSAVLIVDDTIDTRTWNCLAGLKDVGHTNLHAASLILAQRALGHRTAVPPIGPDLIFRQD